MRHVTSKWVMFHTRRICSISFTACQICAWVISRMYESCHICMSHVTYEWVMSRMNESRHTHAGFARHFSMKCQIRAWVMSRMNDSYHVWMSHITYKWVMSPMNESCHVWMSHVTHMQDLLDISRKPQDLSTVLVSAQFLQKVLPPMLAKRVKDLQVSCSMLQYVAMCVAVCCSVLEVCGFCDCTRFCSVFAERSAPCFGKAY